MTDKRMVFLTESVISKEDAYIFGIVGLCELQNTKPTAKTNTEKLYRITQYLHDLVNVKAS